MAANLERLKKRIKTLEEWVDENEAIGGPEGTLDTIIHIVTRYFAAEPYHGDGSGRLTHFLES